MAPRKRTSLVAIEEEASRRYTYKKRKETLIKKTSEISKLCGVDACIVIYGPQDREPDVWPPRENTMQILSCFSSMSEDQRSKNMVDQKGILLKQVEKLKVELRKVEEENCRLETMMLLQDVFSGQCTLADVADFGRMSRLSAMVEKHHNEVCGRMNELLSVPVPQSVGPMEEVLLQASLPRPSADMLSPEHEQYMLGLPSIDVASPVYNWYDFGFDSADMALPKQNQCLLGLASADMAPLLDEQLSLPNLYAVGDSSKLGYGTESADVANAPFGSFGHEALDEISQLLDCYSRFEDILANI
ncbi:MADS-box transcription factor PHERES 2-like [Carex rostrata]